MISTIVPMMLDAMRDQIERACTEWITSGKDIGDMTLLVQVLTSRGRLVPITREQVRELADDVARDNIPATVLFDAAEEVTNGRRDVIPVIFFFAESEVPWFHLCWVEAITKEELS